MIICFNTQASNPDKHPDMPSDAPYHVYEFEDEAHPSIAELVAEGYVVKTPAEFTTYQASIDMSAYEAAIAPTLDQIVEDIQRRVGQVLDAIEEQFEVENILMGITQSAKTSAVVQYLHFMDHYLEVRASDEVIAEIDRLIAAGVPSDLAPFVTEARLLTFKEQIQIRLADII